MIRLNLLPHRLAQQRAAADVLKHKACTVIAAAVGLSLGIALISWGLLWQQQQRHAYLQRLTANLAVDAQHSQALSAQIAAQQAQQAELAHLMAQQALPWFLLTQLQALLPPSLHLTQLAWQPPYLTLEGLSHSHEAIALLMTDLNQTPWLNHATLLSSQQQADAWAFALSVQMEQP
ncbi:MAG: PilN domain-containing protein [Neisseriaceae bacterium]|nr:PilN domain-containing protein [Neisseriaceae bacterium]